MGAPDEPSVVGDRVNGEKRPDHWPSFEDQDISRNTKRLPARSREVFSVDERDARKSRDLCQRSKSFSGNEDDEPCLLSVLRKLVTKSAKLFKAEVSARNKLSMSSDMLEATLPACVVEVVLYNGLLIVED